MAINWEVITKLGTPIFAQPILVRLLICGIIGAVIFSAAGELLRAALYRVVPTVSGDVPAILPHPPAEAAPTSHAEVSAPPGNAAASHIQDAHLGAQVNVGSVTSTNQTGGITAGYIGSVQQDATKKEN